jgi:hypothetical protein
MTMANEDGQAHVERLTDKVRITFAATWPAPSSVTSHAQRV